MQRSGPRVVLAPASSASASRAERRSIEMPRSAPGRMAERLANCPTGPAPQMARDVAGLHARDRARYRPARLACRANAPRASKIRRLNGTDKGKASGVGVGDLQIANGDFARCNAAFEAFETAAALNVRAAPAQPGGIVRVAGAPQAPARDAVAPVAGERRVSPCRFAAALMRIPTASRSAFILDPAEARDGLRPGGPRLNGVCVGRGNGAPGTIRTSDPQIRSLMLYPAELRALARR